MGGTKICVKVTRDGDKITDVKILENAETPGVSKRALAVMPQRIVEANSADVDTVSGGTVTSKGIIEAVKDALGE